MFYIYSIYENINILYCYRRNFLRAHLLQVTIISAARTPTQLHSTSFTQSVQFRMSYVRTTYKYTLSIPKATVCTVRGTYGTHRVESTHSEYAQTKRFFHRIRIKCIIFFLQSENIQIRIISSRERIGMIYWETDFRMKTQISSNLQDWITDVISFHRKLRDI